MEKQYPAEEQGIEKTQTSEEIKQDIETGKKNEDVYSEEGRDELKENDELEPWEEGFMEGAQGGGEKAKCAKCGKILTKEDNPVEEEVNGDQLIFCSAKHAEEYQTEHE